MKTTYKKILYLLYQPYKWLVLIPALFIDTVIFGCIAVLVSWLIDQRTGSYYGGAVWSRFNAWITPMFVTVKGKENINNKNSYIVISNHQSQYDIFLIYGWLGLDIKWVMKKQLRKIPGLGFGSEKVGHIFLDRSSPLAAKKTLAEAKERLSKGSSVVMFPEGTRSRDGKLLPFKRGAFKLALDLNLPILPLTIKGTKDIMPAKTINIMPGKASLTIHPPIQLDGYTEKNIRELMEKVKETIEQSLNK